ncbi:hypothetical protein AHF37_09259 [Paragonimus kellicotti]|nr:hypothetical protein AHF37_09259 [Paragonimus kellicotti]
MTSLNADRGLVLNAMDRDKERFLMISCQFCGGRHLRQKEKCPAYGKTCMKCRKRNHFARQCRSPTVSLIDEDDSGVINRLNGSSRQKGIYAELLIEDTRRRCQLDSGASVNVISSGCIKEANIRESNAQLKMWNGAATSVNGVATLPVTNPKNGQIYMLDFFVVDRDSTPILGVEAIQLMGFITVNHDEFLHKLADSDVLDQYSCVFNSTLGHMSGAVSLSVVSDAVPVALPVRGIPLAIRDKCKAELDRLVRINVIAPVEEPTDWVSQIAVILKSQVTSGCVSIPSH